ncbi:hypothetical protein Hanom_Chr12g01114431 [Helianthus anomalus]
MGPPYMVVGLCRVTETAVNSDDGYSMTVLSNDVDHGSGGGVTKMASRSSGEGFKLACSVFE